MRDSLKKQRSYALILEQRIWGSLFEAELNIKSNAWQQIFKTDSAGSLGYVAFGNTSPIVAMCVEELKQSGVTDVIRIGTCGGLHKELKVGELILAVGAVRGEGTSSCYADLKFPAVASPTLLPQFSNELCKRGHTCHMGNVWTTDGRYVEQDDEVVKMNACGVLSVDMETSALYVVSGIRRMNALSISVVSDLPIEELGEAVKGSMDKECSKKVLKTVGKVVHDITDVLRSA